MAKGSMVNKNLRRSRSGKLLDISEIIKDQGHVLAITNTGPMVNARGDILGAGGKIIKTAEEIKDEHEKNPKIAKKVSLQGNIDNLRLPAKHASLPLEEQEKILKDIEKQEKIKVKEESLAASTSTKVKSKRILVEDTDI